MSINAVTLGISFSLSVFSSVYLLFHINGGHYETPFSCLTFIIALYWLITLSSQSVFILRVFSGDDSKPFVIVSPHFIINNICHFFWVYFFTRERFFISEMILIGNLLNLLMLYFNHHTSDIKSIRDWITIHFPIVGWPLSWTLYCLFWNGATLIHSHNKSLLPRLIANLAIWEFLLVPLCILAIYGDWSVGLSTSLLMLGVGLKQLFHRIVALQWGFALVISAIDFTASLIVMFSSALNSQENQPLVESATV